MKEIILDTGCTQTLVRKDLMPPGKETGSDVCIRCEHGDVVSYQLTNTEPQIDGRCI